MRFGGKTSLGKAGTKSQHNDEIFPPPPPSLIYHNTTKVEPLRDEVKRYNIIMNESHNFTEKQLHAILKRRSPTEENLRNAIIQLQHRGDTKEKHENKSLHSVTEEKLRDKIKTLK
ncbi:hypothetical protein ACJMK2_023995 [Sinanodonta woodiana]|uniref:Uncharacterized protein n=1 Tax=Sinanodonta woodiana TaxID=1069815 RepID=A0ABD3T6T0_SINWO